MLHRLFTWRPSLVRRSVRVLRSPQTDSEKVPHDPPLPPVAQRHGQRKNRYVAILSGCVLCVLLVGGLLWLFIPRTSTAAQSPSGLMLQVDAGFDHQFRADYWTPVRVALYNAGPAFQGMFSVRACADMPSANRASSLSPWSFEQAVTLPSHSDVRLTLYAPLYQGSRTRGFVAALRDQQGTTVASGTTGDLREVKPGHLLIGFLSESSLQDFGRLQEASIPNQVEMSSLARLTAETMPSNEAALENFDVIVLEHFNTAALQSAQFTALSSWVNRGGALLEIGGVDWQRTLSPLPPALSPVAPYASRKLPAGTSVLPVRAPLPLNYTSYYASLPNALTVPLPISSALVVRRNEFSALETMANAGEEPLIVKAHQGAGTICYAAYDPAAAPLKDWESTPALWRTLLVQVLGERLLISSIATAFDSGPGQFLARGGLLNQLVPATSPNPWLIGVVLVLYLLALGPVSVLLLRRLRHSSRWHWHVVLSCILLFSLVSYGLASYQKRAALTNTSISVLRLNQGGSIAHVTTYQGLFTPGPGDFTLHLPGQSLTQPVALQYLPQVPSLVPRENQSVAIVQSNSATDLTFHNKGLWTLNPLVSERDQQLQGELRFVLTLRDNRLVGMVTNTLSVAINDVYVLLPHSFVPVGRLNAGETRRVDMPLYSADPAAGKTLADQIAEYQHLPAGYFPYAQQQQPQTMTQTHVAFLSALSGASFSSPQCQGLCQTHSIMHRNTVYATGGLVPNPNLKTAYDQLLIPGAQATVIGWIDQPFPGLDEETLNNAYTTGLHMSFVQMPLNIDIAGQSHLPLDFVTGDVMDIQGYDGQEILPGMYSLTTGNMTFSLPLPAERPATVKGLTITVPDLLAHPSGSGTGSATATTSMRVRVYNWHTQQWETPQLVQDTFTVNDLAAYAGPQEHVLVQIDNDDYAQIYFGKPSLNIA